MKGGVEVGRGFIMVSESGDDVETLPIEGSPISPFSLQSLGSWTPRLVSPESVVDENLEGTQFGLDTIPPLSWLECTSENSDDHINMCVNSSLDCNADFELPYRVPGDDVNVGPNELHEAYSRGTFHSLFWKIISPEDPQASTEWNGHRPLDPAYPELSPRRNSRRRFASRLSPRSSQTDTPVLIHAVQSSPESNNVEIVLLLVCTPNAPLDGSISCLIGIPSSE